MRESAFLAASLSARLGVEVDGFDLGAPDNVGEVGLAVGFALGACLGAGDRFDGPEGDAGAAEGFFGACVGDVSDAGDGFDFGAGVGWAGFGAVLGAVLGARAGWLGVSASGDVSFSGANRADPSWLNAELASTSEPSVSGSRTTSGSADGIVNSALHLGHLTCLLASFSLA